MKGDRYAPVARFEILQDPIPSGVVIGIASPAAGPTPCALALISNETTIATGSATGFSDEAAERGIRLGWCVFEIGGLQQAVALGHDVELRCIVSGEVQTRWEGSALAAALVPPRPKYLTFGDLRKVLRAFNACTDLNHILPFALDLGRTKGSRAVLRASYRYFLERLPEPEVDVEPTKNYTTSQAILQLWDNLGNSQEYKSQDRPPLAGPFDPRFPFPLDALDESA